jgi:hypothetical protein
VLVAQSIGSPVQTALNGIGALLVGGASWFHVTKVSQSQNDDANREVRKAVSDVKDQVQFAANSAGSRVSDAITQVQQSVADLAQTAQTEIQRTTRAASDIVQTAVREAQAGSERALKKLDDDLREQECVLAITHPLLDYVSSRSHDAEAQGFSPQTLSGTFLTTVLWTEQDSEGELSKVAYAAFGITGLAAIGGTVQTEAPSPTPPPVTTT